MKWNSWRSVLAPVAAAVICVGAQLSWAAPTVYFDRDDNSGFMTSYPNSLAKFNQFTAALGSFGVDGVDAAAGVNPTLAFGPTGITGVAQGVVPQAAPGFSIGTQALLELDAAGAPQVNTIFTFNQYITAFGAYVIQGGDGTNDNSTTLRLRDTVANTVVDVPIQIGPNWGTGNVFFVGVTDSTPFNEVEIIEAADFVDGMLYDNIVAGALVPEPSSLALLMLGAAVAFVRKGSIKHR